jgi:excisionase family DNA binding protein
MIVHHRLDASETDMEMQETNANHHGPKYAHSVEDAARIASSGRTTVYEEINAGRLKARKVGRRTLILDEDLRAWLASLPVMKGAA